MRIDVATAFLASAFLELALEAGAQSHQFQQVIDGGANPPGVNGISLEQVADTSDALPGGTASSFAVSREAISNGRIAFRARIGTEDSIFVTREPGAFLARAAVLAAIAALHRLRPSGFASASRRAIRASTL